MTTPPCHRLPAVVGAALAAWLRLAFTLAGRERNGETARLRAIAESPELR